MKKYILLTLAVFLLASCTKPLYKFYNYDEATFKYSNSSEIKDLRKVSKSYAQIVEDKKKKSSSKKEKKSKNRIPPGACVDYAYLLILQGDTIKAKSYLIKEKHLYPESSKFVENIEKQLGL